jgi:hypothetical protein
MDQGEVEMSADSADPAPKANAKDEVVADRSPRPPANLRRRARILRVVNVPMRLLLRLPFRTPLNAKLMLLSFKGRKTGRAYLQPVSYVPDGDTLLTPAGGRWKLNLSDGEPIRVWLRGVKTWARPAFVRDPDEVARLLRLMMTRNPRITSFVPFIDPDGHIDRGKLEKALSYGFAILRWRLDGDTPR